MVESPVVCDERFSSGTEGFDGTKCDLMYLLVGANDDLTRGQAIEVRNLAPPVIMVWELSEGKVVEQRPFSMDTLQHIVRKYMSKDAELAKG